jgi:hypothetical protein
VAKSVTSAVRSPSCSHRLRLSARRSAIIARRWETSSRRARSADAAEICQDLAESESERREYTGVRGLENAAGLQRTTAALLGPDPGMQAQLP